MNKLDLSAGLQASMDVEACRSLTCINHGSAQGPSSYALCGSPSCHRCKDNLPSVHKRCGIRRLLGMLVAERLRSRSHPSSLSSDVV
jgi:hypothetical protein